MRYLSAVILILVCWSVQGQTLPGNLAEHQEFAVLQVNNQFFLSGEEINYHIQLIDQERKPSLLSKVVYVELIDQNKHSVLRQITELKDGSGVGQIYVPSTLPSGPYWMIAYSRWMQNFPKQNITRLPVTIVNPFTGIAGQQQSLYSGLEIVPECGKAVSGLPNTFVARVSESTKELKIVDQTGEVRFSTRADTPVFRFTWTPDQKSGYQALLIDSAGGINYQEVSLDFMETGIQLNSDDNQFRMTFPSSSRNNMRLVIGKRQIQVRTGDTLLINKSELPHGLLQAALVDGEEQIAVRYFFNHPPQGNISLKTDKSVYSAREAMVIQLEAKSPATLSVNVRRKFSYNSNPNPVSDLYLRTMGLNLPENILRDEDGLDNHLILHSRHFQSDESFSESVLPEFRGAVFRGMLTDQENRPRANQMVALCIPTRGPQLFTAKTNTEGIFRIHLQGNYGINPGYLTFSGWADGFQYQELSNYLGDYGFLADQDFNIPENTMEEVEETSVLAQLQNAYYSFSQDSLNTPPPPGIFYGQPDRSYRMEDYTLFPTVKDILTEYVSEVKSRQSESEARISIPLALNLLDKSDSTILFLNGIPISDPRVILDLNPSILQNIDILSRDYIFGPVNAHGMINFETKGLKMDWVGNLENTRFVEVEAPQTPFIPFTPDYSSPEDKATKIPDLRTTLYWNPRVSVEDAETIKYFTSDIPGTYEVLVNGFCSDGRYISETLEFEVR